MKYGFLKVAAAVPYVKVADCFYNISRMKTMILDAETKGVEILCFPELSITGYTCGDLFLQPFLLEKAKEAVCRLVAETAHTRVLVIVGAPVRVEEKLFNAAIVFQSGRILGAIPKTYLPNYREFQEKRWFSPARDLQYSTVLIGEERVPIGCNLLFRCGTVGFGIEICEDMWTPYTPGTRLSLYGAQIIFNLSASNENAGKHAYLRSLISGLSSQSICAYVYASCGYGESSTDLVYTGKAFIAEVGTIVEEMKRFDYSERMIVSDIDVSRVQTERYINSSFKAAVSQLTDEDLVEVPFELRKPEDSFPMTRKVERNPFMPDDASRKERSAEIFDIQVCGLRQRLHHLGAEKVLIGLSGGLDSTLALLVTVRTFDILGLDRKGIISVTMPGFGTSRRTLSNATKLMDALGVTRLEIDIQEACRRHFMNIGHDESVQDLTFENTQARERTQILMDLGSKYNAPVIGTGDLSELALGWTTYNGDHMSMYAVNSGVPKTTVQLLIRYIAESTDMGSHISDILMDVLGTPISPELLPTDSSGAIVQNTEQSIGPYELHDFFIYHFLYNEFSPEKIFFLAQVAFDGKYTKREIKQVLKTFFRRFFAQQYKRNCLPDGPKVGCISLSPRGEWRMPSDAVSNMWINEVDQLPED
ncbi:NAD synthetase [Porphyromonas crevioricanis JCM 15906]|uniref:Glutamine-dependent NAD(+) synthetase n=2 Tax=Porphyromonas crevioricanis TaxID=393921 RepID=A0AB34PE58_9PORP|nr:NAD(+) synthase [Porphyromonas crevioricanis]KGN93716.1 NAD synthetase [Porphyromonas crevioricanis]GAD06372.1 NAD synthetase [Porphyromonas crevioricanis JCM 15906]SKA02637.1 NAD+ synthase (glutamine-hydrolysing) [Porphyromonas crevioricanis]